MAHGQDTIRLSAGVAGSQKIFLGVGILGLVGTAAGFSLERTNLLVSYLTAFTFFLALSLGAMFFTMVQHVARSAWSVTVRRIAETLSGNLRIMWLLALPLFAGLPILFQWWSPEARANDHLIHAKQAYLNPTFFFIRNAVYFISWFILSSWLLNTSRKQDETKDPSITMKLGKWSCLGLPIFALTQTFFAFDWIMTLNPHWFSTMFGVYFFAGAVVLQYSTIILVSTLLRSTGHVKEQINIEHYHDLGKLLFGHNIFWTYIGFSQFMLIWYANISEETAFFHMRAVGTWKTVSLILPWCHFAIPFLFLMSHNVKRKPLLLTLGAVWLIVICFIDIYWLIQPNFHPSGAHFGWTDLVSIAGIGGIFGWFFINQLSKANLIPVGDPRLQECLTYDNGIVE